jgi:hypothetical protein
MNLGLELGPLHREPDQEHDLRLDRLDVECSLIALGLCVGHLSAVDAVGTIKKVDPEKRVLFIHANGQDRTVSIDNDVKVLGADGKPLPDGLKAKELKEGAEVTVTVERTDGGPGPRHDFSRAAGE